MNNLSTDRLVDNRESAGISTVTQTALILTAWLSTLLLSKLHLVIARDILGTDIPWITSAWLVIAALLFVATFIWQRLKPLRSYFLVLGVIYLWTVFDSIIRKLAMLMGKAMLDTRGLGWSWIIHMTIDTVIYIFIAMTMG